MGSHTHIRMDREIFEYLLLFPYSTISKAGSYTKSLPKSIYVHQVWSQLSTGTGGQVRLGFKVEGMVRCMLTA